MNNDKETFIIEKEYIKDLDKIKSSIQSNQAKAKTIQNTSLLSSYYQIGTIINQRKQWGNSYIKKLAEDLKGIKGFSFRNLCRMSIFAKSFVLNEIVPQVVAQFNMPWRSLVEIMSKSKSKEEMLWYIHQAQTKNWSRSNIIEQFKKNAYQKIEPTILLDDKVKTIQPILLDSSFTQEEYVEDLLKIKDIIRNHKTIIQEYDTSFILSTYYEIGTIINQRKQWGSKYIERLANDLKEFKGYSLRNLKYMSQFAKCFSNFEIRQQLGGQFNISWGSMIIIMSKSKSEEELMWYIKQVKEHNWSRATLLQQYKVKAYERSRYKPITTSTMREDLFKDTYVMDFIKKEEICSEADLKDQMIHHIILFLKELGEGFSLVGKEYSLRIPSGKTYKIDILLYHTIYHCYVVIEVKINSFEPQDYGQLKFYVKAVDKLIKTEKDENTIGLLICKDVESFIAESIVENESTPLAIGKYKFIEEIQEYLSKQLKKI